VFVDSLFIARLICAFTFQSRTSILLLIKTQSLFLNSAVGQKVSEKDGSKAREADISKRDMAMQRNTAGGFRSHLTPG